ncbi:MAG: hypothetical protein MZV63_71820 [Marinilabiliales bacterium]|nr:hypothetical protein [Marinilabiliales bacterium]
MKPPMLQQGWSCPGAHGTRLYREQPRITWTRRAHTITFNYPGSNNLNGDYTAGTDTAIPDEVPEYITNSNGVWSDPNIWTPVGASPACPAGGPAGCNVTIAHVVTTDRNFISVLNTTINGELRAVAPTYGHNLGNVDGDGKLYVEGGNLPGGTYTDFTDCSGNATIEYGGSGSYIIVSGVYTSVPNLFFTGTGTRILPNADLTVCKRLVIDGPLLDNSVNNRKLIILGTFERYNSGAFRSGAGSFPAATVSFAGSTPQTIGGPQVISAVPTGSTILKSITRQGLPCQAEVLLKPQTSLS